MVLVLVVLVLVLVLVLMVLVLVLVLTPGMHQCQFRTGAWVQVRLNALSNRGTHRSSMAIL